MLGIARGPLCKWLSNHYAICLTQIQNTIKCKKKKTKLLKGWWRPQVDRLLSPESGGHELTHCLALRLPTESSAGQGRSVTRPRGWTGAQSTGLRGGGEASGGAGGCAGANPHGSGPTPSGSWTDRSPHLLLFSSSCHRCYYGSGAAEAQRIHRQQACTIFRCSFISLLSHRACSFLSVLVK